MVDAPTDANRVVELFSITVGRVPLDFAAGF
jgi:hypothetical protein